MHVADVKREAKGYRFCYKCGKPWKHHDVCESNEKGLHGNTSYATMNWEYPTPRNVHNSPSNSKELVWDHSAEGVERTEAPIVKCAICGAAHDIVSCKGTVPLKKEITSENIICATCKIDHRGVPCPKEKKLDEKMFMRIQNRVEEQEKDRVSMQKEKS